MSEPNVLIERISRSQRTALIIGIVGIAATFAGLAVNKTQFTYSWFYGSLFWAGLSAGALGLYLLNNVVGGKWGAIIRRFLEASAKVLPYTFIPLAIAFFLPGAMHTLFPWVRPEFLKDPAVAHKIAYLNPQGFTIRFIIYLLFWTFLGYRLSSRTDIQDKTKDHAEGVAIQVRMRQFSAPMLLLFVLTSTFAFFDWVMSLEPTWYSTIYGAMYLIGQVLAMLALSIILLVRYSDQSPFKETINMPVTHDLGNLMLAFTMVWAYLSFSQFLITWAGNLPEEIQWYQRRFTHGWGYVAWTVSVFHFCVPFFILLHRFVKRNPKLLATLCVYMFLMRFLDVFWLSQPPLRPELSVSWMDLTALAGIGGIWFFLFFQQLKTRPLLPLNDARLIAMRHEHHHA